MSATGVTNELLAIGRGFEPLRSAIDDLWQALAPDGKSPTPVKIAICGTDVDEGVTTVAGCAAIGLAESMRESVLLVEANLPRPGLLSLLGAPDGPGLGELLRGEAPAKAVLRRTDVQGLTVLPAGRPSPLIRGGFALDTNVQLLQQVFRQYHYVVVDTPPLLLYPDVRSLLWLVDAAVPVFRSGTVKKAAARHLVEALRSAGVTVLGGVLNRHTLPAPRWLIGDSIA